MDFMILSTKRLLHVLLIAGVNSDFSDRSLVASRIIMSIEIDIQFGAAAFHGSAARQF